MAKDNEVVIKSNSTFLTNPGIILQEESDNWGILYNPDNDLSFSINPVSVFVWKQLNNNHTVKELETKVKENFTNVPAEIEGDIMQFLKMLLEKDLAVMGSV